MRETITEIGYDRGQFGFDGDTCAVMTAIDEQSPDIAQGVDKAYEARTDPSDDDELDRDGAGDQGMMFGYATRRDPALMPMPIQIAHTLARGSPRSARTAVSTTCGRTARPRSRSATRRPAGRGREVLISTQHAEDIDGETLIKPDLWEHVVEPVLDEEYADLYRRRAAARTSSSTRPASS